MGLPRKDLKRTKKTAHGVLCWWSGSGVAAAGSGALGVYSGGFSRGLREFKLGPLLQPIQCIFI